MLEMDKIRERNLSHSKHPVVQECSTHQNRCIIPSQNNVLTIAEVFSPAVNNSGDFSSCNFL